MCSTDHAEPSCVSGRCQIESCESPYDDCDARAETGCEANLRSAPEHCGECGNECSDQNGTPSCENGECRIECDPGFDDCDENPANGCEQNVGSDVLSCGECENECPYEEGETPFCADGECGASVCEPGTGNCDGRGDTCEADLESDPLHCGRCGGECTVFRGTPRCDEGTCGVRSCEDGYANCNASAADGGYVDGCETNTDDDSMNCGRCGVACASDRACVEGTCECGDGLTECSGTCVDTATSGTHCGECDNTCTGGRTCVNSVCRCPAGQAFCDGACVDVQADEANCGTCGRVCQTPAGTAANTCMDGACVPTCGALRADCDQEPWDGCEVNVASNNANCGACDRACEFGASAHVSPATQAGNQCSAAGVCEPTCAEGYMDCNARPWDGCEADITTPSRCGSCSNDCAGSSCGSGGDTSCCVASGIQYRCQAEIMTANDVDAAVNGGNLSFMHSLQPGTNRLVLLAVAAEVGGGGISGSRPDIVTYGGTAMIAGPEQSGGSTHWSPDLFFYYLTETGIGTKTGTQTVVVNGTPSSPNPGSPAVIIANLLQLSGVKQANPLGPSAGGIHPSDGDADVISHSLAVATTGSRIYTLTAGMFCGNSSLEPSVTPAGPTIQTLLNNTGVPGSVDMRAAGAYIGSGSATTLSGGAGVTYAPTWTYAFCGEVTHAAVVVSPAP
jgi:hypothetical protein